MPNFTGNYGEIVTRGLTSLTQNTNIKQVVSGSKARSVVETTAQEVENLATVQQTNLKKAFLPTTFGQFLEHFGTTVGLAKLPRRNAEALAEDRVFRFYVLGGGTFGSINGGSGFVIPAGVRLTSPASVVFEATAQYGYIEEPDTVYDRSIHYSMSEDAVVAAADTEVFVSAKALTPGADGNLAAPKMINSHSFTNYSDYLGKTLLVENVKPILNGAEEENITSYRYRISQEILASEKANYAAITSAALSVPGVADVIIIPWEDGAGRFNLYIKSISFVVSDKTLEDVQIAIEQVQGVGTIGYARKPYEVGIEIDSTLTFKTELNTETKDEIRRSTEIAIIRYLNSLDLGRPLILSQLVNELKQVDGRISTVGFNETTFFDSVSVWYPAKLADGGRRREKLIAKTVNIPQHARIIAEGSISDPIRIV
jgi:uncharacterized phage protein gp47/JayE